MRNDVTACLFSTSRWRAKINKAPPSLKKNTFQSSKKKTHVMSAVGFLSARVVGSIPSASATIPEGVMGSRGREMSEAKPDGKEWSSKTRKKA